MHIPYYPMTHYTMTGPKAGTPFCHGNRRELEARGDKFVHWLPFLEFGNLCPDCKKMLEPSK